MKLSRTLLLQLSMLTIVGIVLYVPTVTHPFVLDDIRVIESNTLIRSLTNIPHFLHHFFNRSLFFVSLAFNYAAHGTDPAGYHLVNMILHIGNAVLLLFYLSAVANLFHCNGISKFPAFAGMTSKQGPDRQGGLFNTSNAKEWYAWIPAVIFLIHPVQATTINHITTRSVMLCTFFYLLSFLSVLRALQSSGKGQRTTWYLISAIAFILCLGSKTIGVTLPLMVAVCLLLSPHASMRMSRWVGGIVCVVFLVALAVLLTFGSVWQVHSHGMFENVLTQMHAWPVYARCMLVPVGLVPEWDLSVVRTVTPTAIAFVFVLGSIMIGAFAIRKNYPYVTFALFWIVITLLPSSSIIPRANSVLLYRLYLPIIGFCMLCGALRGILTQRFRHSVMRVVVRSVCVAYGVMLLVSTFYQNNVFGSNILLWEVVENKFPHNHIPSYNIGTFLLQEKRYAEAIDALEKSIRRKPSFQKAHEQLALAYDHVGKDDAAFAEYAWLLKHAPDEAHYCLNLGNLYFKHKQYTEALRYYEKYRAVFPHDILAGNNMFYAYMRTGSFTEAVAYCDSLIAAFPAEEKFRYQKTVALRMKKEWSRAIEALVALIDKEGDYFEEALFDLATVYQQLGNNAEARTLYNRLLAFEPTHIGALYNMGVVLFHEQLFSDAEKMWQTVLQIDPSHALAREGMSRLHREGEK